MRYIIIDKSSNFYLAETPRIGVPWLLREKKDNATQYTTRQLAKEALTVATEVLVRHYTDLELAVEPL